MRRSAGDWDDNNSCHGRPRTTAAAGRVPVCWERPTCDCRASSSPPPELASMHQAHLGVGAGCRAPVGMVGTFPSPSQGAGVHHAIFQQHFRRFRGHTTRAVLTLNFPPPQASHLKPTPTSPYRHHGLMRTCHCASDSANQQALVCPQEDVRHSGVPLHPLHPRHSHVYRRPNSPQSVVSASTLVFSAA